MWRLHVPLFGVCRTNAKWVEMTSVHWYKATAEKDTTAASLLEEDQIRSEMENFRKIVEVSNRWGGRAVEGLFISRRLRKAAADLKGPCARTARAGRCCMDTVLTALLQ
jgi:hypothetical protein